MSNEIGILGLYGLVTLVTILIQATAAGLQVGPLALFYPRDDLKLTGMAARLDRCQINAVIALALFAPAILILAYKGLSTPTTLMAAQIFLVARILYVPAYAFGIPGARTLVWAAGFFATAYLYLAGMANVAT
jgi:uncharacterized MAPEG superfamily protein